MSKALDYSGGTIDGGLIKAGGYADVLRYLKKRLPSSRVVLTAGEYSNLRAHSVNVGLIYEDTVASRMLGGGAAGKTDAAWALQQAKAVGVTSPRCIYFTADWDVQPSQYSTVSAYLDGAASVLGKAKVGLYGGYNTIANCGSHATWRWQTSAWSGGKTASGIGIMQQLAQVHVGGVTCDVNTILAADYGQHPAPATPPPNEEDDMSAQDVSDINGHTDQAIKELRTDTDLGTSIANVVAHQTAQGNKLSALQDDMDALTKTVAEILKAVQP